MSNTGFFDTSLNVFYLNPDPGTPMQVRSVQVSDDVDYFYRPDGPVLLPQD